jgi:hypothetical protein
MVSPRTWSITDAPSIWRRITGGSGSPEQSSDDLAPQGFTSGATFLELDSRFKGQDNTSKTLIKLG